jgi:hypothetical protein
MLRLERLVLGSIRDFGFANVQRRENANKGTKQSGSVLEVGKRCDRLWHEYKASQELESRC